MCQVITATVSENNFLNMWAVWFNYSLHFHFPAYKMYLTTLNLRLMYE